jgi:parallel beta-helix repeat protein
MAITHAAVKASGDVGTAAEWNANHVISDDLLPKNFTTLIVAASNSLDTTRADYVCDAIDDQDTINGAITALPAGGGRISLLEGTYQITGPIIISKNNVSLVGLGSATIIQTSDNITMISATNRTGILIRDVRIVGTNNMTDPNNYGIYFSNTTKSVIYSCWIEDCGWAGIYIAAGCDGLLISLCVVSSNELYGVYFTGDGNSIVGNTIHGNGNTGLLIHISDRNTVTGNILTGNGAFGVLLLSGANQNIIEGNVVSGNASHGILLSTDCSNNVMTNNIVYDNGGEGIVLWSNCDENVMESNQVLSNAWNGIEIADASSDDNIILGCVVRLNGIGQISDLGTNTEAAHNKT